MIDKLFFIFGTAFPRMLLIFLGMIVVGSYSDKHYSVYVNFLLFSNFAVALSSLGIPNRLLIMDKSLKTERYSLISVGLVNVVLVVLFCYLLSLSGLVEFSLGSGWSIFILVFFYVISYFFISCGASLLCKVDKYHLAGLIWFISYLVAALFFLMVIWSNFSFYDAWAVFCAVLLILTVVICNAIFCLRSVAFGLLSLNLRKFWDVGVSGFFSVVLLLGFYVVNNGALALGNFGAAASFSFGMQIFGVLIFIPGIMGGVLLPTMSGASKDERRRHLKKFMLVYFAVALLGAVSCFLLFNSISYLNNLYEKSPLISNSFLAASVVAAVCAAFNQYFFSISRFGLMLFISFVWLLFNLFSVLWVATTESLALCFFLSYCVMFVFYLMAFIKEV